MKKFICAASFMLAFAMAIPPAQAAGLSDAKVPHLARSGSDPNNPRHSSLGNYFIGVHVQGRSLTQLVIEAPAEVRLSDAIAITDQSGRPIDTTVSVNGQKATIAFVQAVAPETTLKLNLKNVRAPYDSPTWFFLVSSQLEGLNSEIPLGLARIQPRLQD
jgi:hypothetical protein